jgi:hypothetical protein
MVAKDEFDQIINETKIMLQRNDDRKDRKRPQTLDLHLNQQLLANEKKHYLKEYNQTLTSIRIVHKVSTINETLSRSDSSKKTSSFFQFNFVEITHLNKFEFEIYI